MTPDYKAALEAKGPALVLSEMADGQHGRAGSPLRDEVENWLRSKEVEATSKAGKAWHNTGWGKIAIGIVVGAIGLVITILVKG